MIGQMYQIHPTQLELFSLRLPLNHMKVDGDSHSSFHDAAIPRNLLKDDKIWIDCMKEAEETETNIHKLRQLFVLILENFNDCLKEDYEHKYEDKFDQFSQPSHCGNGSEFESWMVE
ncbi:hypothetical protein ACHAWF_014558 [Thalassiosira exigua]